MTQTITLGIVSSPNTAQTILRISRRTTGLVSATNAPLAVTRVRRHPIGIVSETDTEGALSHAKGRSDLIVEELAEAQPITVLRPLSGTFASRDDISHDNGLIPIPSLALANLEVGEYAPSLLATEWFEWTTDPTAPSEVRFGFDWSGQSGAGGAAVRVYDGTADTMPGSGDVLVTATGSGAAGAVDATLTSPTPGQRYYIQLGLVEKAGTTTYLELAPSYTDVNSFTPVVPSI
jgi:hypothetical protein